MRLRGSEAKHGSADIMRNVTTHFVNIPLEVRSTYAIKTLEVIVGAEVFEQTA